MSFAPLQSVGTLQKAGGLSGWQPPSLPPGCLVLSRPASGELGRCGTSTAWFWLGGSVYGVVATSLLLAAGGAQRDAERAGDEGESAGCGRASSHGEVLLC